MFNRVFVYSNCFAPAFKCPCMKYKVVLNNNESVISQPLELGEYQSRESKKPDLMSSKF